MHQVSVLTPLVFAVVVDVIMEYARKDLMNKTLFAGDLVLMSESIEKSREKFLEWGERRSRARG